jgi:hypothetical protein
MLQTIYCFVFIVLELRSGTKFVLSVCNISHNLIFDSFTLQYITSAYREIFNLLTGNSQLTLAAILKIIDQDCLPKENSEWARSVTAKAKQFLAVSIV